MSLASTASLWTNDNVSTKKRQPSMIRKTIKKPYSEYQEYSTTQEKNEFVLNNIDDVEQMNGDHTNRVNDIINKMSEISTDNDGAKLADFNPPPKPSIQMKKDITTGWLKPDEQIPNLENPLQIPAPSFSKQSVNPYVVNNANVVGLGNYQQVYDSANVEYKPYYAKMGLGSSGSVDNKMMEKINYMIHYTFLGVFIIFVLDSFSKTSKYVR